MVLGCISGLRNISGIDNDVKIINESVFDQWGVIFWDFWPHWWITLTPNSDCRGGVGQKLSKIPQLNSTTSLNTMKTANDQ